MRQLLIMTGSDLRQRVRDKSLVIFGLLVPLALMTVLNLVIGGAWEPELEDVTVAVSAPPGDPLAATVLDVLAGLDGVEVSVARVDADAAAARVDSGAAHLGLVFPEGFTEAVTAGEAVTVDLVEGDQSGLGSAVVVSVVRELLGRFAAGSQAVAAGAEAGLPPDQFEAIAAEVSNAPPAFAVAEGTALDEQLDAGGALVAGQAGLFLFFTIGFGVLALVQEREQGTAMRLLSLPMRPGLIVGAKALGSFLLGVLATTVLLTVGAAMFDTSFGASVPVGALILAASAAVTALMFVVARLARTSEQASLMQVMIAMLLGMAGGAFFPISADGWMGTVLDLNPVAALVRGLGVTAGGGGLGDLGGPLVTLLGFALVVGAVARILPDRGGLA